MSSTSNYSIDKNNKNKFSPSMSILQKNKPKYNTSAKGKLNDKGKDKNPNKAGVVTPVSNNNQGRDTSISNDICSICSLNDPPLFKGADVNWLHCSVCKKWVHSFCENVKEEDFPSVKDIPLYFCTSCVGSSNLTFNQNYSKTQNNSITTAGPEIPADVDALIKGQLALIVPHLENLLKNLVSKRLAATEERNRFLAERVSLLEKKVLHFENRDRSNNIIIRGIPAETNVSLRDLVCRIAELIGFHLDKLDVSSTRRIVTGRMHVAASEESKDNCSYVVSFSSTYIKSQFLRNYFIYIKGKNIKINDVIDYPNSGSCRSTETNSNIFINEHLDSSTHKAVMLSRRLKKENKIHSFSVKSGKCFVAIADGDSPRLISSVVELNSILSCKASLVVDGNPVSEAVDVIAKDTNKKKT